MEIEIVWREKEEKLRDERKELEWRECMIMNRERQETTCPNCGHNRPRIEKQRKERLRPQKLQKIKDLNDPPETSGPQLEGLTTVQYSPLRPSTDSPRRRDSAQQRSDDQQGDD